VVYVPAKLAARVRLLPTGRGRKNDDADATSVGIGALIAAGLPTVAIDEAVIALRALVEHRDDLVKIRTQILNRLHGLLTQLITAGAPAPQPAPRPRPTCCARYACGPRCCGTCVRWPVT
jgi:transposase